jgi:hypothetical protein
MLHCFGLCFTVLNYVALFCIMLYCVGLCYTMLDFVALLWIMLHCFGLGCTAFDLEPGIMDAINVVGTQKKLNETNRSVAKKNTIVKKTQK